MEKDGKIVQYKTDLNKCFLCDNDAKIIIKFSKDNKKHQIPLCEHCKEVLKEVLEYEGFISIHTEMALIAVEKEK